MSGTFKSPISLTKLQVASQVLCQIVENLNVHERLGIVLFDDTTDVLQPLSLCSSIDRDVLKQSVLNLKPRGGTNWSLGMEKAIDLFSSLDPQMMESSNHSNRIIFLTDACPNIGGSETLDVLAKRANNGPYRIYSTYIGVGLDFNSDIVEGLTKIRGSNYFSAFIR